jgi:hypothetical protein
MRSHTDKVVTAEPSMLISSRSETDRSIIVPGSYKPIEHISSCESHGEYAVCETAAGVYHRKESLIAHEAPSLSDPRFGDVKVCHFCGL